ncbi:MAG TPA: 4-hydroxy-tetrahydrodipicolinate reductase [Acidimicrobiales bacterium]|nr:4-hydroxy-tetrahydrodipicolinate reductase [Acidimicrobiales bacterium]
MLRIGVIGAAGRMGSTVCRAVVEDPGLELVAAIDPSAAGRSLAEVAGTPDELEMVVRTAIDVLADERVDVVVDFTLAAAAVEAMHWCAERGIACVSGTSGLSNEDLESLREAFSVPGAPACIWAPNFAIGAVLMMKMSELAAPFFDSVEVIEMHHDGKRDAPSGTAIETARMMAAARTAADKPSFNADPTRDFVMPGARGATGEGSVHIHSLRMLGLVAHQEVIFGAAGQTLSIRHDSHDRVGFMPGVIYAVKAAPNMSGLTVGLAAVLGI